MLRMSLLSIHKKRGHREDVLAGYLGGQTDDECKQVPPLFQFVMDKYSLETKLMDFANFFMRNGKETTHSCLILMLIYMGKS